MTWKQLFAIVCKLFRHKLAASMRAGADRIDTQTNKVICRPQLTNTVWQSGTVEPPPVQRKGVA